MAGIPNKRPENHKEYTKLFGKGIDNRSAVDIQGVVNKEKYLYSRNARVSSRTNFNALERIDGEELRFNYVIDNEDKYVCINSENINNHIVAFWASVDWREDNVTPGLITIDDNIVLESDKFPIRHCFFLDIDKNESCLGGEIYITDNNLPPMYFNIKDLIDSFHSGSLKYFDQFDYTNYTINLKNPTNTLSFRGLKVVGGLNGRPVGQYSYSYRAVSNDGDKTNWSVATPLIIVPRNQVDTEEDVQLFKFTSTRGDIADSDSNTNYAPVLRLRIDNFQGYNYIELKRTEYNNGQGIGYTPQSYIVQRIQIFQNQFSVLDIIDSVSNQTDRIPVSSDDETNAISVIKRAEAVKYFKNKIILGNVEYEQRDNSDIQLNLVDKAGEKFTPMMVHMEEKGFRDPIHACYHRSYLNGEIHDFALVLWDDSFQRTYVYTFEELRNIKFPDKRKAVMPDFPNATQATDYYNTIFHNYGYKNSNFQVHMFRLQSQDTNANNVINQAEDTFEVVLHTGYTKKLRTDGGIPGNQSIIMQQVERQYREPTKLIANITQDSFDPPSWNSINPANYGYEVRNPVSDNDIEDKDRTYGANIQVFDGDNYIDYNPDGFCPHYNSLGLCIFGITGFPEWVKAFSIVRTKAANRVIAQGLGVYSMKEMGTGLITPVSGFDPYSNTAAGHAFDNPTPNQNEPTSPESNEPDRNLLGSKWYTLRQISKDIFTIHCSFPDFESGFLSQTQLEDIIKNPSSYKLQIAEPLGFFSEVFNGDCTHAHDGTIDGGAYPLVKIAVDQKIDMVTYARCQDEDLMPQSKVGLYGRYSRFGGQRGDGTVTGVFYSPAPNGYILDIYEVRINTDNEDGVWFLEIKTTQPIWLKESLHALNNGQSTGMYSRHYNNVEVKNFHESLYIVNILNTSAEVPDSATKEYLSPLNYIKLESKIGISNGSDTQSFQIVDERPEDFFTHPLSYTNGNHKKFIFIKKAESGKYLNFINITWLSPSDISIIDNDINTGSTVFAGKQIHGKFKAPTKDFVEISLSYSYTPGTISTNKLSKDDEIYVRYDNTQQISVFGGEILHNDAVFTYKNRRSSTEGVTNVWQHPSGSVYYVRRDHYVSQFGLGVGFPFMGYVMSSSIYKHHYYDHKGRVQEERVFALNYIRQWLFLYTCQARTNLSYMYGDYFPNINYVERPNIWNKELSVVDNKIFSKYNEDYPNEKERWTSGGFRINMFKNESKFNFDFSKEAVHDKQYSRQEFLKELNQKYCTRLVWSQTRPIDNYGSPNLKSFRPFNYFDLPDKYGDIRKLHINTDSNGDNLYVFCENEVALVLAQKQTISGASGQVLTTTSTNNSTFIGQEIPLNVGKNKGLQKLHKWSFTDNGNEVFFINENGVFNFTGGKILKIIEGNNDKLIQKLQEQFGVLRVSNTSEAIYLECLGYAYYDVEYSEYGYDTKFPRVDFSKFYTELANPIEGVKIADITDANNFILDCTNLSEFTSNPLSPSATLFAEIRDNSNTDKTFYFYNTLQNNIEVSLIMPSTSISFTVFGNEILKVTKAGGEYSGEVISQEILDSSTKLFVYCDDERIKSWTSEYDYMFDRVLFFGGKKYGFRDLKIYELEKGNVLNGSNIKWEVEDVINDKDSFEYEKEHISIQINTNTINRNNLNVDFYKLNNTQLHSTMNGSTFKKYGGLWNYINKDVNSKRHQGNFLLYRLRYDGTEKITLQSVNIAYKTLK